MRRFNVVLATIFVLLFTAVHVHAQAQSDMRYLTPTASLTGNTGFWNVQSASNLMRGQVAFSAWVDRINRNPGQLTITTYGFGGSAGLTDWLELGVNFDVNRRVLVRRADQLSLGQQQLGFFGNKTPGASPTAAELFPTSTVLPRLRVPPSAAGALSNSAGYYYGAPFASRIEGNGVGTVGIGLKFNILSQSKGAPLDFGFRTYAEIPTHRSVAFLEQRPSQTGGWIYGTDFLFGGGVGRMIDVAVNIGIRGYESPNNGRAVVLPNSVPFGFGLTIPRDTRIQFMGELTSETLFGNQTRNVVADHQNPIDLTLGFRAFVNRYLNLSAGYRRPLDMYAGDKNGFVVQLGYTYGAPKKVTPPAPPSLSCSADPAQVDVGGMVRLSANGSTSNGAPLTFEWTTASGTIQGSGQNVQLSTAGLAPGSYVATVRATEKPGLFADCTARFTVVQPPPPPMPPTANCIASPTRVQVGEAVNLNVQGNSPDGHPLTYAWTSSGGTISGTGASVRLDTTGARPGTITATAKVTDDRNLSASCTSTVTVEAPPPPPPVPQVMLLDTCQFGANSARVDNVCKAKLDSIALRLQSESDSTLTIVGSAASNERNAQRLSQTRADNVRAYLSKDKGIAEGRLTSRTAAAGTGVAARKAEMHLVPRGATFMGYNLQLEMERSRSAEAVASTPAPASKAGPQAVARPVQKTGERRVIASLQ
jgi:outer membrane protein OmpA-like peptidoglycan-associated protein